VSEVFKQNTVTYPRVPKLSYTPSTNVFWLTCLVFFCLITGGYCSELNFFRWLSWILAILHPLDFSFSVFRMPIFQVTLLFFWVVTPCELVSRYQNFREISCSHLHDWRWRQYVYPQ
jgi:hypothetical protein